MPTRSVLHHMSISFNTVLHGKILMSCVGLTEWINMEIVKEEVEGHGAVCHCLNVYSKRITNGISNGGIGISLIHQRDHCQTCGKEDTRNARLLRCSSCWKKLRVPVWYCNSKCQMADHPHHKHQCGRIPA